MAPSRTLVSLLPLSFCHTGGSNATIARAVSWTRKSSRGVDRAGLCIRQKRVGTKQERSSLFDLQIEKVTGQRLGNHDRHTMWPVDDVAQE